MSSKPWIAVGVLWTVAAWSVAGAAVAPAAIAGDPPQAGEERPRTWTDEAKLKRLAELDKLYEENRRNQDLVPVRTRRGAVILAGDMYFAPAAKFLKKAFDEDRDLPTRVAPDLRVLSGYTDDATRLLEELLAGLKSGADVSPVVASLHQLP